MAQTLTGFLIFFYGSMVWAQTGPHSLNNLYQQTSRLYDLTSQGQSLSIISLSDSLIREYKNFPGADRYLGFLYIYMAEAAKQQGDISLARYSYELASQYFPEGSEISDYQIPVNLLSLELDAGRFSQCLIKGIPLLQKETFLIDPARRGTLLNNIADAALEGGSLKLADSLFNILFSLIRRNVKGDGFDIALTYRNYGLYKLITGFPIEGKENIKVALRLYHEKFGGSHFQVAKSWQSLGRAYKILSKPDSSLLCFEKARRIFLAKRDSAVIEDNSKIGIDYETLYLELLIDEIDLKRNLALKSSAPTKLNSLLSVSSNVTEALNRYNSLQQGMICSESGFILADKMRSLLDMIVLINLDLFKILGKEEYVKKSLYYSMQSTAISLESKARLEADFMQNDSMRAYNLNIYRIRDELLRNPDHDTKSKLIEEYISFRKLLSPNQLTINSSEKFGTNQVKNLLKSFHNKRQLLCFHQIDSTILVFNLLRSKIIFSEIHASDSLKQDLDKFYYLLASPQFGNYYNSDIREFYNLGTSLYRILLKPFLVSQSIQDLLINKDGMLNSIPFDALVTDNEVPNFTRLFEFRQLPFVLKTINISYTSGLTVTKPSFNPSWHRKTMQFIYCPNDSLAPEINKEANSLGGRGWEISPVCLGDQGLQFSTIMGKADVLHISCHVSINRDDSDKSFIGCSGQKDGKLIVYQLLNLNISQRLVFLNGCETGSGKLNKGEGALSPAFYFLLSGSAGVIQHLWKAPDGSSEILASEFYKVYHQKNVVFSLARSKRKYLEICSPGKDHPHYWAGIIFSSSTLGSHSSFFWKISIITISIIFFIAFAIVLSRK